MYGAAIMAASSSANTPRRGPSAQVEVIEIPEDDTSRRRQKATSNSLLHHKRTSSGSGMVGGSAEASCYCCCGRGGGGLVGSLCCCCPSSSDRTNSGCCFCCGLIHDACSKHQPTITPRKWGIWHFNFLLAACALFATATLFVFMPIHHQRLQDRQVADERAARKAERRNERKKAADEQDEDDDDPDNYDEYSYGKSRPTGKASSSSAAVLSAMTMDGSPAVLPTSSSSSSSSTTTNEGVIDALDKLTATSKDHAAIFTDNSGMLLESFIQAVIEGPSQSRQRSLKAKRQHFWSRTIVSWCYTLAALCFVLVDAMECWWLWKNVKPRGRTFIDDDGTNSPKRKKRSERIKASSCCSTLARWWRKSIGILCCSFLSRSKQTAGGSGFDPDGVMYSSDGGIHSGSESAMSSFTGERNCGGGGGGEKASLNKFYPFGNRTASRGYGGTVEFEDERDDDDYNPHDEDEEEGEHGEDHYDMGGGGYGGLHRRDDQFVSVVGDSKFTLGRAEEPIPHTAAPPDGSGRYSSVIAGGRSLLAMVMGMGKRTNSAATSFSGGGAVGGGFLDSPTESRSSSAVMHYGTGCASSVTSSPPTMPALPDGSTEGSMQPQTMSLYKQAKLEKKRRKRAAAAAAMAASGVSAASSNSARRRGGGDYTANNNSDEDAEVLDTPIPIFGLPSYHLSEYPRGDRRFVRALRIGAMLSLISDMINFICFIIYIPQFQRLLRLIGPFGIGKFISKFLFFWADRILLVGMVCVVINFCYRMYRRLCLENERTRRAVRFPPYSFLTR